MSLLTQGISQVTAAAKAGMSERTARKYAHSGRTPSSAKVPHTWRTRPDPFAEVWPEVEALLRQDSGLQAKTIWTELNERHAGSIQCRATAHTAATIAGVASHVRPGSGSVLSANAHTG